jgi:hypothetical protein
MSVLEEIRRQAHWCGEFGSPFMKQLLGRIGDDLESGGIVAELTHEWPGNARADAVSLRLAGALHAAALTKRDAKLAELYPASSASWSMDHVWPAARDFFGRERDWVAAFLKSPPQTNETGRATGLAAAFMWLAEHHTPQPFHMLELGASAGLNMNWDGFRYGYGPWGRTTGDGPFIPTEVAGSLPHWRPITVASRAACDQNPLDPADPDQLLHLRAYVWADQVARLERLDAAVRLAVASARKVEKADAAEWVKRKLDGKLPVGTSIVYHSVFYQYPPREIRAAIADNIEEAGRRAMHDRQLAWVRFEPDPIVGGPRDSTRYVLNVVRWTGAERLVETIADVDPHGRTMEWHPRPKLFDRT